MTPTPIPTPTPSLVKTSLKQASGMQVCKNFNKEKMNVDGLSGPINGDKL